ncbi:MAG: selenocysteine-specific translation elongation factor, partial [Actinobacteria bacterium]|nr:selenocysteine-specific translation elongation factor [Actinomycetota bacterium]
MHVVATAGHVDHGKSTLIKALTGTDPDRLEEEKARGLTIDLGFAGTKLPSGRGVSFIDVPGHVRFLKNMLAGVGGVDACIFVVAATEGWKPQSEEHLRILSLLGIRHGIVALTKVGHVDDELATIAHMEIADRTEGTFLADAPIVPVDAIDGHGIDDLTAAAAIDPANKEARKLLERARRAVVDNVERKGMRRVAIVEDDGDDAAEINATNETKTQSSSSTAEEAKSRGNDLFKAKRFADAVDAYTEALAADPTMSTALCNRSGARYLLGE